MKSYVDKIETIFADTLKKQEFTKKQINEINTSKKVLEVAFTKALQELTLSDKRFGPNILEPGYSFTIPDDYNFDTYLENSKLSRCHENLIKYGNEHLVTRPCLEKYKPIPGKKYIVKAFEILTYRDRNDLFPILTKEETVRSFPRLVSRDSITYEDLCNFITSQNGIPLDFQAFMLLYEHEKKIRDRLFTSKNSHLFPTQDGDQNIAEIIRPDWGDQFNFTKSFISEDIIICFCEK